MATPGSELIVGLLCLAGGVIGELGCWFLKTRRPGAIKEADEGLAKDGLPGVLDTFRFSAALMLFIGAVLVAVSFVAYACF